MTDDDQVSLSAKIPNKLVYMALAGGIAGGLTLGTIVPFRMDTSTVQACYDEAADAAGLAQTALDVAKQHGQEFVTVNKRLDAIQADDRQLHREMIERTAARYTSADAARHVADQERKHKAIDEVLNILERRLRQLEKDMGRIQADHESGRHH